MSNGNAGRALGLTAPACGNFERGVTADGLEHLVNVSRITAKPSTHPLALDTQLTDQEEQLLEHFRRVSIPTWHRNILDTVALFTEAAEEVPESLLADHRRAPGEQE